MAAFTLVVSKRVLNRRGEIGHVYRAQKEGRRPSQTPGRKLNDNLKTWRECKSQSETMRGRRQRLLAEWPQMTEGIQVSGLLNFSSVCTLRSALWIIDTLEWQPSSVPGYVTILDQRKPEPLLHYWCRGVPAHPGNHGLNRSAGAQSRDILFELYVVL